MKTTITVNGVQLTGEADEVIAAAKRIDPKWNGNIYHSSTHGPMLIEAMDTFHILNAILKQNRLWAEQLRVDRSDPAGTLRTLLAGPQGVAKLLAAELFLRQRRGEL